MEIPVILVLAWLGLAALCLFWDAFPRGRLYELVQTALCNRLFAALLLGSMAAVKASTRASLRESAGCLFGAFAWSVSYTLWYGEVASWQWCIRVADYKRDFVSKRPLIYHPLAYGGSFGGFLGSVEAVIANNIVSNRVLVVLNFLGALASLLSLIRLDTELAMARRQRDYLLPLSKSKRT